MFMGLTGDAHHSADLVHAVAYSEVPVVSIYLGNEGLIMANWQVVSSNMSIWCRIL